MVIFSGRVGICITWDELVTFLGRDGHRLTNSANKKYWGYPIMGVFTPSPASEPLDIDNGIAIEQGITI